MSLSNQQKVGVLLINLGTPDSPSVKDVRRYLKQFLSDPRVVEMNRLVWWCVLNLIILNTRPKKSSAAYQKVWTEQGSPLMVISKKQTQLLQDHLDLSQSNESGLPYKVELAMCYGNPSIKSALNDLQESGVGQILVLPLYPQYSATTTAAIFDAISRELNSCRNIPELRFIKQYYQYPDYIDCLANSISQFQEVHGKPDQLVFSFHGIPQEYCQAGDPYFDQCHETVSLLRKTLELDESNSMLTFQSRLGPKAWLQPYTDTSLAALGASGVHHIQVVCPGFSVDCLETLEEIALENKEIFLESGGKKFQYIPCLNENKDHIQMLARLVQLHSQGWTDLNTPASEVV